VTRTALRLRRSQPALFLEGSYEPILVDGPLGEHVVAFERRLGEKSLLCVVPRFACKLAKGEGRWPLASVWEDASLRVVGPGRTFRNVFTGERLEGEVLPLKTIFSCFPVAWLEVA
jgi:(1->4)-alpha-D-glucan 1-alpha-D-glucosylmutase